MSVCSTLVIMRRYGEYAVAGLLSVVVVQALGYGLIFDLNFFLRNLSVIGGLLMVLGDSFVKKRVFAGLPTIDEKDKKQYIQLGGRVLLIFLFIGFVFAGEWTIWRVLVSLIGFVACVMVVVGFKAKLSAIILVLLLSIFNILVNNFWTVSTHSRILHLCILTEFRSCIRTIPTRTSPSMISSKSCRSWVVSCFSLTWVRAT
jgi:ER-derived vesicles protein